jgi:HTH-type transcriptional regulator/antitoxin HipB
MSALGEISPTLILGASSPIMTLGEIPPGAERMAIRDNQALGRAIRQSRLKAGLTQAALGDKANLRQRTVSDVERGRGAQTETIFALLTALGLEIELSGRSAKLFVPEDY